MISDEESEIDVTEDVKGEPIEEAIDIESVEDAGNAGEKTSQQPAEVEEDSGEWSFETDYVVLKNNQDYQELLKTVVTLQAQRVQMVKDLETVLEIKEQALKDPMAFVKKMERRESLGIPPRLTIAKIPEINWSQYNIGSQTIDGPATRGLVQKVVPTASTDTDPEAMQEEELRVRGRPFNVGKSETFNQLWTVEEQQRLEELLNEFPPEEKESRRWGKIAAALGNRTKNQVASRVQKYFIKLHSAGLPVPGRVPRSVPGGGGGGILGRHPHSHSHRRYNHHLFRPTTFFPNHPRMADDPDDRGYEDANAPETVEAAGREWSGSSDSESDSDDDTMQISEKVAEAEASRTSRLLERVAEDKEKNVPGVPLARHTKYKCDLCEEEPVVGTRWHCPQCAADFCGECVVSQLDSANPHPSSHHLEAIRTPNDRIDLLCL